MGKSSEAPWVGKESGVGRMPLKGQGVCPLSHVPREPPKAFEEDSGRRRAGLWEAGFSLCDPQLRPSTS